MEKCRICLNESTLSDMVSIFNSTDVDDKPIKLVEMLNFCTRLSVSFVWYVYKILPVVFIYLQL